MLSVTYSDKPTSVGFHDCELQDIAAAFAPLAEKVARLTTKGAKLTFTVHTIHGSWAATFERLPDPEPVSGADVPYCDDPECFCHK